MLDTKRKKTNELSRRLDWKLSIEKDNKNQSLIKEQWICRLAEVVIKEPKVLQLKDLRVGQQEEPCINTRELNRVSSTN